MNVTGTVNNFAIAQILDITSSTVVGNGDTIDLGPFSQGASPFVLTLTVRNAATGPADLLSGSFSILPPDGTPPFTNMGFNAFSGLQAGLTISNLAVSIDTSALGLFSETITLLPTGSNASGYSGDLTAETFTISAEVVCFAAGTPIRTEAGEVYVERLRAGDRVVTRGASVPAPVRWVGRRRIDISRHPDPRAVLPVRVSRDAFADGVPYADLWLSPDHAVFIEPSDLGGGVFIPVRLLLNGGTIAQEQGLRSIEYFHVELDSHAVLFAAGLPAESYLDTGNRGFFANADSPVALFPSCQADLTHARWVTQAAAPLAVSEVEVRPVWQRLAQRSASLGHGIAAPVSDTSRPLSLFCGDRALRPIFVEGGRHIFALQPGTRSVRLVSDVISPAERRPWLDDRRQLGVGVLRIVLHGPEGCCDLPLDHPMLARGWWDVEREGARMWRWTNGNSELPVPAGTYMVEFLLLENPLTEPERLLLQAAS